MVEVVALARGRAPSRDVVLALLAPAALTGAFAAGAGYVLSREPGYEGSTVTTHLVLGLIVAAGTMLSLILHRRARAYRLTLFVTAAMLLPTGHFGSILTHGAGFITAPLHESESPSVTRSGAKDRGKPRETPAEEAGGALQDGSVSSAEPDKGQSEGDAASEYDARIAPVFSSYCTACHGETRTKGGLALNTPASILAGGEDGPVLVPGDAANSDLIRRMRLPLEDRDHMPPDGKRQPNASDVDAIESWIARGAPMPGAAPPGASGASGDSTSSGSSRVASREASHNADGFPPANSAAPRSDSSSHAEGDADSPLSPPDAVAIEALRERLVHVAARAQGENELVVDFAAAASTCDDADVEILLTPVLGNICDLSLSRARISDALLPLLSRMPRLERLDLRHTPMTTAGLADFAGHPRLRELVLAQTALSDDAIDALASMPALKRVYLWHSGISSEAVAELKRQRPELLVDVGDDAETPVLEAETVVRLGADAPDSGAPSPPPASADALRPVNDLCPVTGKPVDPKYAIVFRGKVVGFCCPNCPGQFWSNPDQFVVAPRSK